MKVVMRKYPEWFGPYQLIDTLFPRMEEDKRADLAERYANSRIGMWHTDLAEKYIEWKGNRRIKVHIDPWDTWSMDGTLAHIILPMLIKLRDDKQGAPFTDDEDVPEQLRSSTAPPLKNEWDTDDYFFARWDWIMGEMIYAFEAKLKDEGIARNERMVNGFKLFGKYYQGLWD